MKKWIKLEHIIILGLSLIGLALRLHMIYHIPTTQLYDFETYYKVADSIFRGMGFRLDGYPIAFQGMGYSTLLGVWFKLFGNSSELLAKQLNVLLSMLNIGLVYYIMHRLTQKKAIIIGVTAVVILLPHHIAYCNAIGSEVLSAFLLTLVIAIQVTPFKKIIKYPILGMTIGILALTKPFFIAYPLVIALMEWLHTKDWRDALKLLAVSFVAMALVIAPWTYRNYQQFGRFIPISYNSGFNLYINNNAHNINGGWLSFDDIAKTPELQEKIDAHLDNPLHSVKIASDIELDFKPEATKWISENFGEFLKLGVIRIHSTYFNGSWDLEDWTMNDLRKEMVQSGDPYKAKRQLKFMRALYDILLSTMSAFGLWFIIMNFKGIILGLFNKKKVSYYRVITFMNLSFVSLVYFVYEGQPRYNFIVLFLLIFAAADIISTYIGHHEAS